MWWHLHQFNLWLTQNAGPVLFLSQQRGVTLRSVFSHQSKALNVGMFCFCYWFFSAEHRMHSSGWILNLLNMTSNRFLVKETRVLICEAKVLRQISVNVSLIMMNENFQNGQYLKTPDLRKSPTRAHDCHYFIAKWGAMMPVMRGARTNIQDRDSAADTRRGARSCSTACSHRVAVVSRSCDRGAPPSRLQTWGPLLELCCDAIDWPNKF